MITEAPTTGFTPPVERESAIARFLQSGSARQRDERPTETRESVTGVVDQMLAQFHGELEEPGETMAPTPVDASCESPVEPAGGRRFHPVHVGKGWPEKYAGELDEPHGGEWRAGFALLSPVIEAGGIGLLHGKRGTGKTRMAAEIARSGRFPHDQTRGKKIEGNVTPRKTSVYRTAMRFFLEVRATFKEKSGVSEIAVIDALTEPGLLVIDELQERGETPFEDRLLVHLIDARYNAMRPTILIANLTKEELQASLGPSITDRLAENGRRVEFTWDSYRRGRR